MRILNYSPAFLPQLGGLEIQVATLSEGLATRGHEVVVVTAIPGRMENETAFRVVRCPGPGELLRWVRWCDVFHHANVSLRGLWPLLFVRRPWVVSHHGTYQRHDGTIAWQDAIKRAVLRFASGSIAVSAAVARDLETPSVVIGNGYRDRVFRRIGEAVREERLLFVGRLVSQKGLDLLLEALALLRRRGAVAGLSVVGEGPDSDPLRAMAEGLGIGSQIRWLGALRDEALALEMNRHSVLVVPSRIQEAFGLVALEGIACGCLVVGSRGGGLADAIGACGVTFPNGDVPSLAAALERALADGELRERCRAAAPAHLAAHVPARMAEAYEKVMIEAVQGHRLAREGRAG